MKNGTWVAPKEQKHYGVYYENMGLTPALVSHSVNDTFRRVIDLENRISDALKPLFRDLIRSDDRLDKEERESVTSSHIQVRRKLVILRTRGVKITYRRKGDKKARMSGELAIQYIDSKYSDNADLSALVVDWRKSLLSVHDELRVRGNILLSICPDALMDYLPSSSVVEKDVRRFSRGFASYVREMPDWLRKVTERVRYKEAAYYANYIGVKFGFNGSVIYDLTKSIHYSKMRLAGLAINETVPEDL